LTLTVKELLAKIKNMDTELYWNEITIWFLFLWLVLLTLLLLFVVSATELLAKKNMDTELYW